MNANKWHRAKQLVYVRPLPLTTSSAKLPAVVAATIETRVAVPMLAPAITHQTHQAWLYLRLCDTLCSLLHSHHCQAVVDDDTYCQVFDGALAGGCILCPEAEVGHHGQATVGDLVLLVLLVHGGVTAGEADGVEEPATCDHTNRDTQARTHTQFMLEALWRLLTHHNCRARLMCWSGQGASRSCCMVRMLLRAGAAAALQISPRALFECVAPKRRPPSR